VAWERRWAAKKIPKRLMKKRKMDDNGEYREESGG
jgi:hypothetical protein